jgi:hypothetical protein
MEMRKMNLRTADPAKTVKGHTPDENPTLKGMGALTEAQKDTNTPTQSMVESKMPSDLGGTPSYT